MAGISEADMNRIQEFASRNKFERSPELLCPEDDEEAAEDGTTAERGMPAGSTREE